MCVCQQPPHAAVPAAASQQAPVALRRPRCCCCPKSPHTSPHRVRAGHQQTGAMMLLVQRLLLSGGLLSQGRRAAPAAGCCRWHQMQRADQGEGVQTHVCGGARQQGCSDEGCRLLLGWQHHLPASARAPHLQAAGGQCREHEGCGGGGRLGGGGGMEVTYNGVSAWVYAQQTCSWRNVLCVVLLLEATLCHMHHLCTLKSSSMQRITLAAAAKHHMQAGAKLSAPALGRLGSWSWASSLLSWHCSSSCRSMCCPCESSGDGGPWPGV